MRAKVVTVMRRYVQNEVNQEDSEQNEVDAYLKERLVICIEEDIDGQARVTADEEWVLRVD